MSQNLKSMASPEYDPDIEFFILSDLQEMKDQVKTAIEYIEEI